METLLPGNWGGGARGRQQRYDQQQQQGSPWATRLPQGGPQHTSPPHGHQPMEFVTVGGPRGGSPPRSRTLSNLSGGPGPGQYGLLPGQVPPAEWAGIRGGGPRINLGCCQLLMIAVVGSIALFLVVLIIRFRVPTKQIPALPGTTLIDIVNNEWSDGVVFCRGPMEGSLNMVYLDASLMRTVVGSEYDCSIPGADVSLQWGEGVPGGTTLALGLKRGETFTLYLHPNGTWMAGACWFQDEASNRAVSLAKGPRYMSLVEFSIQESGKGQIYYDMSSVEGVSGGMSMNYTDDFGKVQTDSAVPGMFTGGTLAIVAAPEIGFPTVLSDKNTRGTCQCIYWDPNSPECNSDACFAGCPGSLVDNPCGQHRCRAFYAKLYQDPTSYCGWLYTQQAQTYCWAMDEWMCVDETCGYGGFGQPTVNCTSPMPPDAAANSYSCGHGSNLPGGRQGQLYWTTGGGCVDKFVKGVPTNPAPARSGGRISISFEVLPWLHR